MKYRYTKQYLTPCRIYTIFEGEFIKSCLTVVFIEDDEYFTVQITGSQTQKDADQKGNFITLYKSQQNDPKVFFQFGLLKDVQQIPLINKCPISLKYIPEQLFDKFEPKKIVYRDWQKQYIQFFIQQQQKFDWQLLLASTGAGKTLTYLTLAEMYKGKVCIISNKFMKVQIQGEIKKFGINENKIIVGHEKSLIQEAEDMFFIYDDVKNYPHLDEAKYKLIVSATFVPDKEYLEKCQFWLSNLDEIYQQSKKFFDQQIIKNTSIETQTNKLPLQYYHTSRVDVNAEVIFNKDVIIQRICKTNNLQNLYFYFNQIKGLFNVEPFEMLDTKQLKQEDLRANKNLQDFLIETQKIKMEWKFDKTQVSVECPCCLGEYENDEDLQIILLECGHSLCRVCSTQIKRLSTETFVKCPVCRQKIIQCYTYKLGQTTLQEQDLLTFFDFQKFVSNKQYQDLFIIQENIISVKNQEVLFEQINQLDGRKIFINFDLKLVYQNKKYDIIRSVTNRVNWKFKNNLFITLDAFDRMIGINMNEYNHIVLLCKNYIQYGDKMIQQLNRFCRSERKDLKYHILLLE